MADRSTAAVGVANEGGEAPSSARQGGATPDGTTTDDQTSGTAEETAQTAAQDASAEERTTTIEVVGTDPERPGAAPADADPEPEPEPVEPTAVPAAEAAQAASVTPETAAKNGAKPAGPKTDSRKDETPKSRAAQNGSAQNGSTQHGSTQHGSAPTGSAQSGAVKADSPDSEPATAKVKAAAPDLHSGHKLARRYQLAECVTRVDGFSSWRAVDEKLRRAVGIHVLPATHERARQVLAAARSAALLGDPRFVQVLDAVEEDDLVYVIHEWLPDATSLSDLLAAGPLEPHEAYQMVSQVSQGMAAAHREGLSHLRLDPGAVLRTVSGQYRIRGLAVAAALRGLSSERPQRQDTEAIGALLYASLTQRWPYEDDAHGLPGLPKGVGLIAPDQVRAGIHRGLSEIAMRALVNDGATASREEPPCTTPEELAKAVAGIPRIRPPEHVQPVYRPPAFHQPPQPPGSASRQPVAPPMPPPTLPGRTGQALKWAVATLLIVAIGLGSWQLADALKSREDRSTGNTPTGQKAGNGATTHPASVPIKIVGGEEFAPDGNPQAAKDAGKTYDGNLSTDWETRTFVAGPKLAPYKKGVGIVYDLGAARSISSAALTFRFSGDHTSVEMYAVSSLTPTGDVADFTKLASNQSDGGKITLQPAKPAKSRYVLIWITAVPYSAAEDGDGYAKAGYKQALEEVSFTG